jgi:hypothetical protein
MNLLSRVARLSERTFEETRRRWDRLKQDGAHLRVLDSSGLMSAALTYFDEIIIASVSCQLDRIGTNVVETKTSTWQKCARVVGDALYRCNALGFHQVHDPFVWFRLRALMETDRLDSKGDTSSMRDSFVRVTS